MLYKRHRIYWIRGAVGEQVIQETRQNGGGARVSYGDSMLWCVRQAWP